MKIAMEPEIGENWISALPSELLALLTSYLDMVEVARLIKASNKTLMMKLRHGGLSCLQFAYNHDHKDALQLRHHTSLPVPFPQPSHLQKHHTIHTVPPTELFTGLTSFTVVAKGHKVFCKRPRVEHLPPTLTHLDWHFPHPLWTEDRHARVPLHKILPRLLHLSYTVTPFSQFNVTLPASLLSLRVRYAEGRSGQLPDVLANFSSLPQELTTLALIPVNFGSYIDLNASHLVSSKLPPALTDLQLPLYRYAVSIQADMGAFKNLTHFHCNEISTLLAIQYLPRTLTSLHVHSPWTSNGSVLPAPAWWPEKLTRYKVSTWPPRMLLECPPTVTHMSVMEPTLLIGGPFWQNLGAQLRILDLPYARVPEGFLLATPSHIQRITIRVPTLQGSTIPKNVTDLDSLAQLTPWFHQHRFHFQLIIRKTGLFSAVSNLDFGSTNLVSITAPWHYPISSLTLPSCLTTLSWISIDATEEIDRLPTTLTSLHFHQSKMTSSAIQPEFLFRRCPGLTRLSTSIPVNSTVQRELIEATLTIAGHYFPDRFRGRSPHPSQQPGSCPSTISTSDIPSDLEYEFHPLHLPGDVLDWFYQAHPKAKFEGFNFTFIRILDGVPLIVASEAVIEGIFRVGDDLALNGFALGLQSADFSQARFKLKISQYPGPMLHLPDSITTLKLSLQLGAYCYGINGNPHLVPPSVTDLSFSSLTVIRDDLFTVLPPKLTRLEIENGMHGISDKLVEGLSQHTQLRLKIERAPRAGLGHGEVQSVRLFGLINKKSTKKPRKGGSSDEKCLVM